MLGVYKQKSEHERFGDSNQLIVYLFPKIKMLKIQFCFIHSIISTENIIRLYTVPSNSILDPPTIVNPPLPIISTSGESHNFTCTATGHPVPVVSWTFNSVLIFHNSITWTNRTFIQICAN